MKLRKIVAELSILCASVVGVYALIWTFFEVSGWFGIDFPKLRSLGALGHYALVLHGVVIALFIHACRIAAMQSGSQERDSGLTMVNAPAISPKQRVATPGSEDIDLMRKDLISAIEKAHDAERHEEVIRFGSALNRPLFVSGNHAARLRIGKLVEDAAVTSGEEKVQAEMLIDAIGWSYVELGDLDSGEKSIQHGLELAIIMSEEFLISRAYRHLGAIERRRNEPPDYGKAKEYFTTALEHALKLPMGAYRAEATAGCYYATASLNFHQKDYQEAIRNLDRAIADFSECGKSTGVTRSMTKKADACIALGRQHEAKDLLRKALSRAKKDSFRNQVVRASIGLAKIHVAEREWVQAAEYVAAAKSLAMEMNVMNEIKEIATLEGRLPESVRKNQP